MPSLTIHNLLPHFFINFSPPNPSLTLCRGNKDFPCHIFICGPQLAPGPEVGKPCSKDYRKTFVEKEFFIRGEPYSEEGGNLRSKEAFAVKGSVRGKSNKFLQDLYET